MKTAVALGTFDGLHKGHLSVLDLPCGYSKTALVFKIPPKCVKSGNMSLLLTPEDKQSRLNKMGFNVEVLDFGKVENISAEDFLSYIKETFNPSLLSCGFNYRFGKGGKGDTAFLAEYALKNGIELKISNPVEADGEIVSSSRIRDLIANGEIVKANGLLGSSFGFSAQVIKGDGRGRSLGFPTINQAYPRVLAAPKFGVYKTQVEIGEKTYNCITNIGVRPTFPVDYVVSETFIKDFSGDLYGKNLRIDFNEFLREEIKFSSLSELKKQVLSDIEKI